MSDDPGALPTTPLLDAEYLAARLHAEGRTVRIAYPPTTDDDWNDMLQQGREAEIKALIEAAPTWTPPDPPLPDTNHDAASGTPEGHAKELEADAKRLAGLRNGRVVVVSLDRCE